MYLDERSNLLLQEILGNPEVSNVQLEEKFQLSRRQVSYSLTKINDWLESNNFPKIKRTSTGKFIVNPNIIDLFTENIDHPFKKSSYIPSEKERAKFILLMLLSSSEELSLIHFVYALKVSKNTILRDIKAAQYMIEDYQLEIVYSRIHGYELSGSEWNKRKLLIELLQDAFKNFESEWYLLKFLEIPKTEIEHLKKLMEKVEAKLQLKFSDERVRLLQYTIAILYRRVRRGDVIDDFYHIHYEELSDTKEYEAAEIIIQELGPVPKTERLFITLQLLTANVLYSQILTDQELPQLRHAIMECLKEFERKAIVELKDKEEFLDKLMLHMKPAYYRIKYHLTTNYKMIEKVSDEFEAIHYIVKDSLKPLEEYINCPIPEEEIAFFTILIGGHLLNSGKTIHKKKKAVVVCPNGVSISNLMENSLRDLFPEFYFYDAFSIREFQQLDIETDLIFSAVPIQTDKKLFIVKGLMTDFEKFQLRQRVMKEIFGLNTNVINVDQLISIIGKHAKIHEMKALERDLQEYFAFQISKEEEKKSPGYNLADLINLQTITIKENVDGWHDAIELAAQPLLTKGSITEKYIDIVKELYPSVAEHIVLGRNIAIPHASPEDGVNRVGMSLLKINKGIPLEDGKKLHLVVIIAAVDKNQHLNALLQLMKLASTDEIVDKIISANHQSDIFEIINMFSR
ncbi:BglG family transcription antiterminator [Neobacillus sedimentimangrovi]|uniref:Ascorbate-specific PTS system EIIA component n=1 Tax=Neobacillus sedimentimangrovi TaxID=2699460 RepID=A0ABS8QGE7_9BACI|nr:BglG family transcription antiterminator [Neobacillus sedimentimangrovi]MCD4838218.1 BglG family transcription antiterminator [Neobacillus sedimentimangrovi]